MQVCMACQFVHDVPQSSLASMFMHYLHESFVPGFVVGFSDIKECSVGAVLFFLFFVDGLFESENVVCGLCCLLFFFHQLVCH